MVAAAAHGLEWSVGAKSQRSSARRRNIERGDRHASLRHPVGAFCKQRQPCTGPAIERLQSMPRRSTGLPESSFARGLQRWLWNLYETLPEKIAKGGIRGSWSRNAIRAESNSNSFQVERRFPGRRVAA